MSKIDLRDLEKYEGMKKTETMGRKKKPVAAQNTYDETKRAMQEKRNTMRMLKR